jgi:hypothetical protein
MNEVPENNERDPKYKVVYTIVERENKKPIWIRIGAAFVNRDQSMNVMLDAHPQNGKLHIRDYAPAPWERGNGEEGGGAHRREESHSYRAQEVR